MYAKLIVAFCAFGVVRGSGLLASSHLAYNTRAIAVPAVPVSSYASRTEHAAPLTAYSTSPVFGKTFAAPTTSYTSYGVAPAVSRTITPVTYYSYSSQTAHATPAIVKSYAVTDMSTYTAPLVSTIAPSSTSYSSYSTQTVDDSPVTTYSTGVPATVNTVAFSHNIPPAVSSYSSYTGYNAHGARVYPAPALSSYTTPAFTSYAAPIASYSKTYAISSTFPAPAISTYAAAAPVLKSTVSYSTTPIVSHIYSSQGTNYN